MRRKRAIFTITHNEFDFFPIWIRYFSRYFEGQDIYVLDHDSIDGSVSRSAKEYAFNWTKVHHQGAYNNQFITQTMIEAQRDLLAKYELVLCCDADELILADPDKWSGLDEYLDHYRGIVSTIENRSVQQMPDEDFLSNKGPLLSKRSVWFKEPHYEKTVLTRIPLIWNSGYDAVDERGVPFKVPFADDLILVHMARIDWEFCQTKHNNLFGGLWDNEPGVAVHHELIGEELKKWFISEIEHNKYEQHFEFIPERYKVLI